MQAGHDGLCTNNLIEFVVTDKYKVNENTLSLCWVLKLYLKTGIFEYKYNSASYLCYNPLNKIYIVILIGIIKTSSMVNMADALCQNNMQVILVRSKACLDFPAKFQVKRSFIQLVSDKLSICIVKDGVCLIPFTLGESLS